MAEAMVKGRRAKARDKEVVLGALAERLDMLDFAKVDEIGIHTTRIRELMDELRRATNKNGAADEE